MRHLDAGGEREPRPRGLDRRAFVVAAGGVAVTAAFARCNGIQNGNGNGGAATGLAFASDWSTRSGTSAAAVTDGGKWDGVNTDVGFAVVEAGPLDFPPDMTHVLSVAYNGELARGVTRRDGWALPPIGGVLCFRLYWRMAIAATIHDDQHPVQAAYEAGACPYAAEWVHGLGSTYYFQIANLMDGQFSREMHRWTTSLQRDATYRVEERYERIATDRWKLHVRIYDHLGSPIVSDPDLRCDLHNDETLASQPDIVTPLPECLRHKMIVHQGKFQFPDPDNRIYYGGFAVSLTDWCGPYQPGEGG